MKNRKCNVNQSMINNEIYKSLNTKVIKEIEIFILLTPPEPNSCPRKAYFPCPREIYTASFTSLFFTRGVLKIELI